MEKARVGVNYHDIYANESIVLEVNKEEYLLNCKEAIEFINQYKSVLSIGRTKVGIISKSILRKITTSGEVMEKKEVVPPQTLFDALEKKDGQYN